MDAYNTNASVDATPEVTATLKALAHLSWQAASLAAESQAMHTTASALLEELLRLGRAQRGTILTSRYLTTMPDGPLAVLSPSLHRLFRPLARERMEEEEALALMATFWPEGGAIQMPADEPGWLLCQLPLPASPGVGQEAGPEPSDGATVSQAGVPFVAFLLLGWTGTDEGRKQAARERVRQLLPLVADGVCSVLATLLLSEHVRELESLADQKAVREMELLKAEMLASVSHELRSPLASIKGYAATLLRHERRISREERHEFLLAINEGSDRLTAVIDRLLEMSQLETETVRLDSTSINLVHLVREALAAMQERVGKATPVSWTLRLEDGSGRPTRDEPLIYGDQSRLREVVDHLLENALAYSPQGGAIEVVIRSRVQADYVRRRLLSLSSREDNGNGEQPESASFMRGNRQMVELCVRDSGIGIPAEHLERIFERFHRVDTRLTREVNGLGLGLAICKRIVALHHGLIWAESEVGQGSIFHVLLPMEGWA